LFIPGEEDKGSVTYHLNPVKERHFNRQSFVMPKPSQTYRVFAFGGSTTYGNPYIGRTAFVAWFKQLIENFGLPMSYESVNAGGISYASYRVARLVEEMAEFSPDLYLVYSGHNEFLEARTFGDIRDQAAWLRNARAVLQRSRIYTLIADLARRMQPLREVHRAQLSAEVEATLEEVGGPELYHRDAAFRDGVIRQYEHSLRRMARFSKARRIPLVLCTVPSNLSGVSPFKSEHRVDLGERDLMSWESDFIRARAAVRRGDFLEALRALQEAEALDDQYALLHFEKGKVLSALGRNAEAFASFSRARDEDIVPLRAIGVFNDIVRRVAEEEGVVLADVEAFFIRVAEHGIPGNDLFVDHVHPSIEGQQMVAWVIVDAATKAGIVPLSADTWQQSMPAARAYLAQRSAEIPERYRSMGEWGVGRLFFWAGKYMEAEPALARAWLTVRDVKEIPKQLAQIALLRGDAKGAMHLIEEARRIDPRDEDLLLVQANAQIMLGEPGKAMAALEEIHTVRPAGVHHAKGLALEALGRGQEAGTEYLRAVELAPEVPSLRLALANNLVRAGNKVRAEEEFVQYLRLSQVRDPERQLRLWREGAWEPQPMLP
jgi:tetratricopeptide (TPR) repeat protein